MSEFEVLRSLLGASPWPQAGNFEVVEREWGVPLPIEYSEIGSLYGDVEISGFMFVCGPRTLGSYARGMAPIMEDNPIIPLPILPSPGGMLLWGNTVEGDQLFLVDRGAGKWTVSAFLRNFASWYESELTLASWLERALSGEIAAEWLPEWPDSHVIETLGA